MQKGRVTILTFHDPDPAAAEPVFAFLSAHYDVISLRRYVEACERGDARALPPRPVIVTFDDGHRRNFELLPILERHSIPATLFVCSSIVGTNRRFWFLENHPDVSNEEFKRMPTGERLERLAEIGFQPEREYPEPQALDRAQMKAMGSVVDLQSHTMFHPCLNQCTDEEALREVIQSKVSLQEDHQLDVWALAYPCGFYTERILAMVRDAGYRCGLTVESGFNTIHSDLFRLKRIDTNDATRMDEFIVRSSGLWDVLKGWRGRKSEDGVPTPRAVAAGR